jgi:hypothetical protein
MLLLLGERLHRRATAAAPLRAARDALLGLLERTLGRAVVAWMRYHVGHPR